MTRTAYATCPLCEATCGLEIEVDGDRVRSIRGDKQDPFSRGYLCPKATALQDLHEDPDRLRQPVRRTASGWQPIGWDEAFDEVAERLGSIRKQHGKNAVGVYLGNPTVHSLGAMTFGQMFLRALPTRNRFSATSADQLPHMLASLLMFGHQLLVPVPDVDRTDFFLILGANPLASNGSLMTAPNMKLRLKEIQRRGGRVVVVDPRRSETADVADQHIFIRPGTDALFLLGLLHQLFEHGCSAGGVARYVDGIDRLREIARDYPPERVAPLTGASPGVFTELARAFAAAPRAVCYGRIGICTQEFGGLAAWLVNCVNIVTGNFDRPGGAMFPRPAADLRTLLTRLGNAGSFGRYHSRVGKLPEFSGELPVSSLADEIETPGDRQIRALVTHAGNPVLSSPNGARLDRALAGLEYMVAIDFYCNETTRHAHIILPPTAALERDHYDLAFALFAVRDVAKWSPAVFSRSSEQRHDWEIFSELTRRIAPRGGVVKRAVTNLSNAVAGALGPRRMLDLLLRLGPHRLSVRKLERNPHGIDLGPLTAQMPELLNTPGKRIELCPAPYLDDLGRLRARAAQNGTGDGKLLLIGRRHLRSNNSWMHNSERLVKGKPRCTLLVHPDDAARFSLSDGGRARITSRTGALEVQVEVTDSMMPGVVSLPHGWGHDRPGVRLQVARAHAGQSVNDLTDERAVDPLSGNAGFNGTEVTLLPLQ